MLNRWQNRLGSHTSIAGCVLSCQFGGLRRRIGMCRECVHLSRISCHHGCQCQKISKLSSQWTVVDCWRPSVCLSLAEWFVTGQSWLLFNYHPLPSASGAAHRALHIQFCGVPETETEREREREREREKKKERILFATALQAYQKGYKPI